MMISTKTKRKLIGSVKSKMQWLIGLIMVLSYLQTPESQAALKPLFDVAWLGFVNMGIGGLLMVLRWKLTETVEEKGTPEDELAGEEPDAESGP